eukprot:9060068-Pyramimonas_sp.AAC.1
MASPLGGPLLRAAQARAGAGVARCGAGALVAPWPIAFVAATASRSSSRRSAASCKSVGTSIAWRTARHLGHLLRRLNMRDRATKSFPHPGRVVERASSSGRSKPMCSM